MKKQIFLVALVLISAAAFGQVNKVNPKLNHRYPPGRDTTAKVPPAAGAQDPGAKQYYIHVSGAEFAQLVDLIRKNSKYTGAQLEDYLEGLYTRVKEMPTVSKSDSTQKK